MTTTGLPAVKVGDPLILSTNNRYRGDEPVTVSRIGRKYLYVALQDGREYSGRFHRDGTEDSQYGARERLYTPEQYDELKQRANLFMELLAAGINVKHEVRSEFTTGQLRGLIAVIKPSA